jgi:PAS domain-containing protein
MAHDHSHKDLLAELTQHFQPILDNAPDGVYLWSDPEHMVCNDKLAKLFGTTVKDWCATTDFLGRFVDPKDQERFGSNYAKQVGHVAGPLRFQFKAKRKDGTTFDAETDMIPIGFGGHVVAYHFVRPAT